MLCLTLSRLGPQHESRTLIHTSKNLISIYCLQLNNLVELAGIKSYVDEDHGIF